MYSASPIAPAGKVIIITGASSGIGAVTAIQFAKLGCRLSLSGRNEKNLNETKQKCIEAGLKKDDVITTVGDVTDGCYLHQLVENTIKSYGKIDVLVNNAGASVNGTTMESNINDLDVNFKTNVRSVVELCQLAAPHLIESKGNVVNVSSILSMKVRPEMTFYSISKAAVDHFTRCFALEMAPNGVRVNVVNPAVVQTSFYKHAGAQDPEALYKTRAKAHALGRVAEPEEVAEAIQFLAFKATFSTGMQLRVDGGMSLM